EHARAGCAPQSIDLVLDAPARGEARDGVAAPLRHHVVLLLLHAHGRAKRVDRRPRALDPLLGGNGLQNAVLDLSDARRRPGCPRAIRIAKLFHTDHTPSRVVLLLHPRAIGAGLADHATQLVALHRLDAIDVKVCDWLWPIRTHRPIELRHEQMARLHLAVE